MDWFRNLSPRGKRIAIVAGGAGLALLIVALSRRNAAAPAATTSTTTAATSPAGDLSAAYLPNAGYDSSTSGTLADLQDQIADLRGLVPGASDIAQIVQDQLQPVRDDLAATRNLVTQPVIAPQAPATPAPQPEPAPAPAPAPTPAAPAGPRGPLGGRRVGPWATAAMRDNGVKGIPAGKVRKYSEGGKFYAEIFD